MAINQDWNIRNSAHRCAHSDKEFVDGDAICTAIFENPETGDFERKDFAAEAWDDLPEEPKPFSYWRGIYQKPEETNTEVVEKESAETLLRRLVEEDDASTENARYILAVMLERKKILIHADTKETRGSMLMFYEHTGSGDVLIIRDPQLSLNELEPVQNEVSVLLGGKARPVAVDTPAAVEPKVAV